MTLFLLSLAVLIGGYFIYGSLVSRAVRLDPNLPTPATRLNDGVDYMPLPAWRVFLIQFLNIAGLGPIFGAIMGVMFGPAAFLWIALGTIFAGAVHDFLSGVMSLRADGASLPQLVGSQLSAGVRKLMTVFAVVLLILVGAVFILTPAGLIASMTPESLNTSFWIGAIFVYYILATLLPIDKLIGNLYPVFGFALLFMAVGIMVVLLSGAAPIPDGIGEGLFNRHPDASTHPIFPMMFVSIACGAISGFHATQSPMMARCLKNERLARPMFYGAMVAEGLVALIWAAAAIAFTGGYEQLAEYMAQPGAGTGQLVRDISIGWLGTFGGVLAILGVVAAPITTGDTALRSARLIVAESLGVKQSGLGSRLLLTLPIFAVVAGVMMIDFSILWRYFAWSNQMLSVFTLWALTVWLSRRGFWWIATMIPAMFMTTVCTTYILFAPRPEGFGLAMELSLGTGLACAIGCMAIFLYARSSKAVLGQPLTD